MIIQSAIAMLLSAAVSLVAVDVVHVPGDDILVRDVVDATSLGAGKAALLGDMVLASYEGSKPYIDLNRGELAGLIRRRVPALSNISVQDEAASIRFNFSNYTDYTEFAAPLSCFVFSQNIATGDIVTQQALSLANCMPNADRPHLKYDKDSGVLRAMADIGAGTYAGRLSVPASDFADKGDELLLSVVIGPVKIEKPVWALQPAKGADKIFVKDSEGTVLRVPVTQSNHPGGNQ